MKIFHLKLLLIVLGGITLNSSAQDYMISFSGKGQSTNVSTVLVENLSTGSSVTLNGDDILHLSGSVGISKLESDPLSAMRIYPNPMTDNSTVEIMIPVSGVAIVAVYEITGKPLAQIHTYLEASKQKFRLSGIKSGFYLIKVTGNTYQSSCKLLVEGKNDGILKIEKLGFTNGSFEEKISKKAQKCEQAMVDMFYTSGERLKFTGISGIYRTVKTDIPLQSKTITFSFIPCTDSDNNNYPVVEIGTQVWMAENLKTLHYRNGDIIATTNPANLVISAETEPKYQWTFNGNESNVDLYGRLYTWYAANDNRNVCPSGWHIPTDDELTILSDFLGGEQVSGGKVKETSLNHWLDSNTGSTNETGFTALPGGERSLEGGFYSQGYFAYFWSSSEYFASAAWYRSLGSYDSTIYRFRASKYSGFSVRCLKDYETNLPIISTQNVSAISADSAVSGGEIFSDGGKTITERGVCWGVYPDSAIVSDKRTIDGSGIGKYTSILTGLSPNTFYYLRAYAINSVGIAYGNLDSFRTSTNKSGIIFNPDLNYGSVSDIDGNTYKTITIGNQEWMAENLKTTKYSNGDLIVTTSPDTLNISGETEPKYQWAVDGNESMVDVYGRLYTGFSAFDSRNICPVGWKVPSDAEWTVLTNYFGGTNLATIKLKETTTIHWYSPNADATNESGFTSLPGGFRDNYGPFFQAGPSGNWWSSTNGVSNTARSRSINSNSNIIAGNYYSKSFGFSVRCLKEYEAILDLPVISTQNVTGISSNTAISGGNITSDGGTTISERGVCWDTKIQPDTTLSTKTTDGSGTGVFTSSLINLKAGTRYYVRAYATNSVGTVYGKELSFTSNTPEGEIGFNPDFTYGSMSDIEGNSYKTIVIGSQLWMAENLKTTKYNDGTSIPYVSDRDKWGYYSGPAYCWYEDDSAINKDLYGAYYKWFTVNTGKLCPTGWHVPDNDEWTVLTDLLGGEELAGGKMKEVGSIHWLSPNINATNESGFTAIPGGICAWSYLGKGNSGSWWSSTEDMYNTINAIPRNIWDHGSSVFRNSDNKETGESVRCVSDSLPRITQPSLITLDVAEIGLNEAVCGGIITSDGGAAITSCGICWSTSPLPLVSGNHTSDSIRTGTFTSSITGLYENTSYYVRAYATNCAGTIYGNEVIFKTQSRPFTIGQPYQGGLIAYVFKPGDPGFIVGEKHGLIVAPTDQSTGIQWFKNYSITMITGTVLGTGNYNTNKIVETQGTGDFAANLCFNLVLGGYSDWFLPSKDELNILFLNNTALNMWPDYTYWSSSEINSFTVWVQNFNIGIQESWGKTSQFCVRAVRNF